MSLVPSIPSVMWQQVFVLFASAATGTILKTESSPHQTLNLILNFYRLL
jgi:hypothetical protein